MSVLWVRGLCIRWLRAQFQECDGQHTLFFLGKFGFESDVLGFDSVLGKLSVQDLETMEGRHGALVALGTASYQSDNNIQ